MNIDSAQRVVAQKMISQGADILKKYEKSTTNQAPETKIQSFIPTEDTVDISVNAKEKNKETDFQAMLEEMRNRLQAFREELKRARETGEGAAEAWKEKIKCMQIAMRIMSGNKVPEEDHRYLRERDMDLYSRAITMRIEKEDPEEHDRLSEDEEDNVNTATESTPEPASIPTDEQPAEVDVQA